MVLQMLLPLLPAALGARGLLNPPVSGAQTGTTVAGVGSQEGFAVGALMSLARQLLEETHVTSLIEGGQRFGVGNVVHNFGVTGVEAMKEVEDELWFIDGVADVTQGVSEGLRLLAIVGDGKIALRRQVELGLRKIALDCLLALKSDRNPELSRGLVLHHGEVEDLI